jgi:hypothetical protein
MANLIPAPFSSRPPNSGPWPVVRWLLVGVLLGSGWLAAVAFNPPVAAQAPAVMPEYQVKAAYLLRFTRYIEWPAGTFSDASSPIVVGVLGRNPFGDALARTVAGMKSQGREIRIRLLADPAEAAGCQVVFIGQGQERDEVIWLKELRGRGIVTITDSADGLARGAVLCLYVENSSTGPRVVFGASQPAAREAGVQLGALMLGSARHVVRESGRGGAP